MPKGNHRTNSRTSIDPDDAFIAYAALGPGRSQAKLLKLLADENATVSPRTIAIWSRRDKWVERTLAFDRRRVEAIAQALVIETVDMDIRQAALGRVFQDIAADRAGQLSLNKTPIEPRDIVAFGKQGQFMERLAAGEATSKDGVATYNTIVLPILALFEQIVGTLPTDVRGPVTRQFADGVNSIRDQLVVIDNEESSA